MSSTSTQKQQQQQRRQINNKSRNTNAYFDREEYYQRSLINNNNNNNYWNHDYYESNDDFYMNDYSQHRNIYPLSSQRIRKGRQMKNEQRYHSKSLFSSSSSNNNHSYYDNIPPRHRLPQQIDKRDQHSSRLQESKPSNKLDEIKSPNLLTNNEQPIKPFQSASSSSTNSDTSNNPGLTNRKDLHAKNLAAAAIAARQQNSQPQTNLGIVQALMNSLIIQQQQPSQTQSTVQLQYQLTNALLTTMIQQRLKEASLQAQAQQIQAALPTLLAAQALAYQQQQAQSILSANVAHPGTKFNNRPLVKFPVVRPTISSLSPTVMMPNIRPPVTANLSRHRLGPNTQSITALPTYHQVQEIERGISLDEAIHSKAAIDIADETKAIPIDSNINK